MRRILNYNPNKPLVYIHIPKCAGTSVKEVFKKWFGPGLAQFYRTGGTYEFKESVFNNKQVIFGHFNTNYGFAVDKLFPDVEQYITVLRDPLETHISAFFYYKKRFSGNKLQLFLNNIRWLIKGKFSKKTFEIINAQKSWIDSYRNIDDWIRNEPLNYVNHLPRYINKQNFKNVLDSKFIAIGLHDQLNYSVKYFSKVLNKNYEHWEIPIKNVGNYHAKINAELKRKFKKNNELAFLIFDYVRERGSAKNN